MDYRLLSIVVVLVIAGCREPSGSGDDATTGESASATNPGGSFEGGDSLGDGGSGSVEDGGGSATTFGMGDDMPLLTSIPSIKQGFVGQFAYVTIRDVVPTSSLASLDDDAWFYGEDVSVEAFRGLRIIVDADEAPSDLGRTRDLVGYVHRDEQGWSLELETMVLGAEHGGAAVRMLTIGELAASDAATYDDALVGVDPDGGLELVEEGESPGVWTVRDDGTGDTVLLDLRPFGVDGRGFVPGARLQELVGVAEIGPGPATILPRDVGDVVFAG